MLKAKVLNGREGRRGGEGGEGRGGEGGGRRGGEGRGGEGRGGRGGEGRGGEGRGRNRWYSYINSSAIRNVSRINPAHLPEPHLMPSVMRNSPILGLYICYVSSFILLVKSEDVTHPTSLKFW